MKLSLSLTTFTTKLAMHVQVFFQKQPRNSFLFGLVCFPPCVSNLSSGMRQERDTLFLYNLWQRTSSEAPDGGHVSNIFKLSLSLKVSADRRIKKAVVFSSEPNRAGADNTSDYYRVIWSRSECRLYPSRTKARC